MGESMSVTGGGSLAEKQIQEERDGYGPCDQGKAGGADNTNLAFDLFPVPVP